MKAVFLTLTALCSPMLARSAVMSRRQMPGQSSSGGSGPYPANYTTDSTLEKHTIYMPKEVPSGTKLPVLIWGEGGCSANGLAFANMLTQFASHGFMIIASGVPRGSGTTTSKMMTEAIDWITTKAGSGAYAAVDPTRIAAAGQSCGGLEAYDMNTNDKVSYLGIFNSGLLQNYTAISTIKKPGERDYKNLPETIPSWKGNLPVGHGGTYSKVNGGEFGSAGLNWMQWTLQGNSTAGKYFTGEGSKTDGWTAESKNLEKLKVFGGT